MREVGENAYLMVASMQEESDILAVIYGEMINEDTMMASSGHVDDASGRELASWPDGMPGKFRFILPKGQTSFTVRIPGKEIVQEVSESISTK